MSEVARRLNCNRATVKKYSGDVFGFDHAIINGRLMTKYKHAKGAKWDSKIYLSIFHLRAQCLVTLQPLQLQIT
nr:hypothetical protein [Providencia rettgeri]